MMPISETEINVPLLRKAVEWVEEQNALPLTTRQWDQTSWVTPEQIRIVDDNLAAGCGTAYCVAGWLAAQQHPELMHSSCAIVGDMKLHSSDVARELLGITDDQADVLFASTNSAADVRRAAEWIAGEQL